ncbi:transmembrane channel-like protein 7, partial [Stegostoma tigrinum]|uniref:transmembrane channel-like protein 7 n=1 Tax=Stegostoma tigrinum TaxID=3053191 RepID=UPI00286FD06B
GLPKCPYLFYGFYQPHNVHVQHGLTYNFSLAYLLTNIAIFLLTYSWISQAVRLKHSSIRYQLQLHSVPATGQCDTPKPAQGDPHTGGRYRPPPNRTGGSHTQGGDTAPHRLHRGIPHTGGRGWISVSPRVRLFASNTAPFGTSYRWTFRRNFCDRKSRPAPESRGAVICLRRLLLNLLVLAIIGAAFFAIYRATAFSQAHSTTTGITGLLIQYLPSIVITAANLITPVVFNQLVVWEKYSPPTEIQLSLLRSVFLKFASLGVLLYTLWSQLTCHGDSVTASDCQLCGYNYMEYQCWETKVGQEMYKLMIFDFLIIIAVMILVDFPRKMVVQHCRWRVAELWGLQEFAVPQNVLEMVYGQTLCWIGSFYSPLLPLLNTLKYLLTYHLK